MGPRVAPIEQLAGKHESMPDASMEVLKEGDGPSPHLRHQCIKVSSFDSIDEAYFPYKRLNPEGNKIYARVRTMICCVTLLPLRVVMFAVLGMLAYIMAFIGNSLGADSANAPPDGWSLFFLLTLQRIVRAVLWVWGVVRIRRRNVSWSDLEDMGVIPPEQNPPVVSDCKAPSLLVANHLGYVDILTLIATYGATFVSKGAIADTPWLGTIARAIKTLFVRKGEPVIKTIVDRAKVLAAKNSSSTRPLVVFPEGTTTNGKCMIKFRRGIFTAGLPVLPVCVLMPYKHFSLTWESISFWHHLFGSATQLVHHAELIELPLYHPSPQEQKDPKLFAENVQSLMAAVMRQKVYQLNRSHKMAYHDCLRGNITAKEALERGVRLRQEDESLNLCSA
ncbi:unnamed protein product [Chrysoparadoxa australica]